VAVRDARQVGGEGLVEVRGAMSGSPPSRDSQADPESPSLGKRPSERAAMGSWARRTGFRGASNGSDFEINLSDGARGVPKALAEPARADLEAGANTGAALATKVAARAPPGPFHAAKPTMADSDVSRNSSGHLRIEPLRLFKLPDDAMAQSLDDDDHMTLSKHSHMKYELRENPGLGNPSPP
jgi:hypothetical protein